MYVVVVSEGDGWPVAPLSRRRVLEPVLRSGRPEQQSATDDVSNDHAWRDTWALQLRVDTSLAKRQACELQTLSTVSILQY
jgi:hypothetical protein